ncbi:MAG: Rpn family recombination-promoting nuclease/putative transposase [Polyangiaceae bacterium]
MRSRPSRLLVNPFQWIRAAKLDPWQLPGDGRVMAKPPRPEALTQPHDALVKWTFTQREHATGLLKAALPPPLVAAVDWGTLRAEKGSFVDQALRSSHSDLVLVASLGEEPIYFYTLIEHQRAVEPLMVFRMGLYMMRLWERVVREDPTIKALPPIVPLLVHHSDSGWTAATAFQDIVAGRGPARDAIEQHVPHFELRLVDLSGGRASHLAEQALTALGRLVMWCLSVADDDERMEREIGHFAKALDEVLLAPNGLAALEVLLRYLAATHVGLRAEKVGQLLLNAAGPRAKEAIVTFLDEIERRGERRGEREGERKGRAQTLLEQLAARFGALPADVSARVQAADEATLAAWTMRVLTAATLEDVLEEKPGRTPPARPVPGKRAPRKG